MVYGAGEGTLQDVTPPPPPGMLLGAESRSGLSLSTVGAACKKGVCRLGHIDPCPRAARLRPLAPPTFAPDVGDTPHPGPLEPEGLLTGADCVAVLRASTQDWALSTLCQRRRAWPEPPVAPRLAVRQSEGGEAGLRGEEQKRSGQGSATLATLNSETEVHLPGSAVGLAWE